MEYITWTSQEEKLLRKLNSPGKIQDFLDDLPYRCESVHLPASAVLRQNKAHCFDGALIAAAALRRADCVPYLIDLCAKEDDDHILCAFQFGKSWGAVAKSNFPGLRFREPVYRTYKELVASYFEFYFNLKRVKSLRAYSKPLQLPLVTKIDWECDPSSSERILSLLETTEHFNLIEPAQEKKLRPVDKRLYLSQMYGVNRRGAFKG